MADYLWSLKKQHGLSQAGKVHRLDFLSSAIPGCRSIRKSKLTLDQNNVPVSN